MNSNHDLKKLIENLPIFLQEYLNKHIYKDQLLEIILDLGKRPEARFIYGPEYLSQKIISWQDLEFVTRRIGQFSNENRAGIERSLHRISCIRNRQFLINGLTCRIGRAIFGTISIIRDLLEHEKSILILGKPGVGKTTIIREISRILADEMEKRVIVIDTSNEIGGDSDISHLGIGRARRMQVPNTIIQHEIMIQAVENHMPQIIIIDEIGTDLEVLAARTIAEKGVQLIGTTHGNYLMNMIKNPLLADLLGGIQYVILSDEEAKRRGTKKSIFERKASPTFDIMIEINSSTTWTIHENVEESVDLLLQNNFTKNQLRKILPSQKIQIKYQKSITYSSFFSTNQSSITKNFNNFKTPWISNNQFESQKNFQPYSKTIVIYAYSISNNYLKEVLIRAGIRFTLTSNIRKASLVIGLQRQLKKNFALIKLAQKKKIPMYSLNQISIYNLLKLAKWVSKVESDILW